MRSASFRVSRSAPDRYGQISSIRAWLDGLGLGKYAEVFAENEIEMGDLAHLSEEDLRELGLPMGPRKRILNAASGPSVAETPAASAARAADAPVGEAERRQLTVMFCDLVGSTELSQRLDPEELRDINRRYQDAAKVAIERYQGYVARYMGDGVLAYFGYPRAYEDASERAIRAGLGLVDAIADLGADPAGEHPVELAVRVGIATGPVVVGDIIGEGASQESAVVGETPNLAARLQGVAAPNAVVVAASTHALETAKFKYEDLGDHTVKGIEGPVRAWRVIAPVSVEGRFEAAQGSGLTTFVGREQEIGLLVERWHASKEGDGQIALLSGEAGIGKSRIMRELRERLEAEPHTRMRYQCSPYHSSSALYPVVQQLEFAAGFEPQDSSDQRLDKLESMLTQAKPASPEKLALLAALLSIPGGDRCPALDLTPQEQKHRTLQALIDQLEAHSARQPVFIVFEDVHWIDPTTAELVDLMVDAIQGLRVLLLMTFRPEYDCRWSGYPHVTALALNRLTRSQTEALILHVADDVPLPDDVVDQIVAKTDGVPLFVEELTKNVLESGLLRPAGDRYELAGPLVPLAIPASLQDSLMARLDRMAPVKEVAQIGAAIGREFSYELLHGVTGKQDDELRHALEQLVDAELIFRRGTPPSATYTFKHALVQDAAYASLLKSRRQQLHADIAKVITEQRPELLETQPELLAHHYAQAGLPRPAVAHWQTAAKRAIDRSAYPEAIEQLDRAIEQTALIPPGEARDKLELELHVTKLGPLFPVKGYGSREVDQTSARALELSRTVGDNRTVFPTLYARWAYQYILSNRKEMFDLSREYLERAEAEGDDAGRIVGHRTHAVALLYRGEVEQARYHAGQALQLYIPEKHVPLVARFGQDIKVQAINYIAISDALLGNIDEAVAIGAEAIAHARALNHANTLAYALWHIGVWLPSVIRDTESVHRYGAEMFELARRHRLQFWAAFSQPHVAVNGYGKTPAEAAADGEKAIASWQHEHNGRMIVPEILCRIAEAHLDDANTSAAERALSEARRFMEPEGEVYWHPELYRLRGRLAVMVAPDETQAAVAEYERAIAIAREQKTRLLELRAATALARLLLERGDGARAKAVICPVYECFSGGFDKPDLLDARALVEAIG
ncbi:MAG: AAA family ATPase [Gammaproteobacteria bacterium]|nr:AAA family ATPase [Gammaproteobacteria bacterium]NIN39552.1 AAA family ATPase [Gammaproteobacteria bacterium]NIO25109.1 AAA family ATPase [Gammaproteobacteria bacterium]NIO65738.1 AAA family ATPase [Gammaproteobacteria bacterium]NIP45825.1 AAA family ATPase [Gammaproteobacteria bacterium]